MMIIARPLNRAAWPRTRQQSIFSIFKNLYMYFSTYFLVYVQHGGETLKCWFTPLELGEAMFDWGNDGVQV